MRTIGSRGARIRLFERTKGGVYYRAVWDTERGIEDRRSLQTTDRDEADRRARELLAALLREEKLVASGELSLGELWRRYKSECAAFLDNEPRTKKDAEGHAKVLLAFFGDQCDVRGLTEQDQLAFTQKRLAGGIKVSEKRETEIVRARSVEVDLHLLHTMLRWATTVRVRGGQRLLDQNPLAGVRRPREKNPKRPVATYERYLTTRAAVQQLNSAPLIDNPDWTSEQREVAERRHEATRKKWLMLELALILAEATGRRLGSIRQLQWPDIDFTGSTIRWRAESDKKGQEWTVPMPPALRDELKAFRVKMGGAFGGLVFPQLNDPGKALTRDSFGHWLADAEAAAKLSKLDGSLWHAYRRAWATARKDLPVTDVAAAGGWKDVGTLIRCYQQPDDETLLRVMSEPRKVTERAQNG
jgi:integrase